MSETHLTKQLITELPIHDAVLDGLEEAGFTNCTPIQAETLPRTLNGESIAGEAQTGTGKTAAFVVATLHHLMTYPVEEDAVGPWAIMLAPTRELALQIHREAELIGAYTGLKFAAVYGGTGYESQRRQLRDGVDVIIGTPGRIIDFYKQKIFNLRSIEVVVLDEADRMFDLGFVADIRYLLRRMPSAEQRLNLLFSATLSYRVMELAWEHMGDPARIAVESEQRTADHIRQILYHVAKEDKTSFLVGMLQQIDPRRTLVFANTKRAAEQLVGYLRGNGIEAAVISGDIPQNKREKLLEKFRTGELPVLVGTDVAARGLHIDAVSHVINFDLPQDAEDYVHRIGRTARAGESGDAITLACDEYVFSLPDIESYLDFKIPSAAPPAEYFIELAPPKRPRSPRKNTARRSASNSRHNRSRGNHRAAR
ncbi:DEAD/DEAH box helicase [Halorhodospira halochloris]|uniref:ATP-dependent RNA helicase RhlB n=1 Tax=Halorhodospira halochloris TaxID=1052 RepID=A0A0X8XAE6_HALHR|nr:DEAD/DEAH box helicase [Halorhodospira halochloris]MBK1652151.1 RNA helicase [Halorhodospira halochloris]MCG5530579.1 DEAD/DEAH box helicase [Halorhodospira halochloris]MCG5547839.1 DEAD/DEAH box helicase [Halorhodospira halochloris]BAU58431.1 ATP-dependent RNA helicase RhlB [Halorhodospira halochloris]